MKRLTLDQTWTECLKMWKWITEQIKKDVELDNVCELKERWLEEHGYEEDEILEGCFFCEYTKGHKRICSEDCPGAKVDKGFGCTEVEYAYDDEPIAFYEKLLSLNRKRKARKK